MITKRHPFPRVLISAPRKSSGKTTLSLGLAKSLRLKGYTVQSFKKGPDYIDPMWHKAATGRNCPNLDPFLMEKDQILETFTQNAFEAHISLIEGNHGLHDGLDPEGGDSSAGLAKSLHSPVILIVDASGTNRGIAATVLGQKLFDPEIEIGGVILNNVRSARQEKKQVSAIENYCGVPVLGALPVNKGMEIKERHLGLQTVREEKKVENILTKTGLFISEQVDLNRVMEIAQSAKPLPFIPKQSTPFPSSEVKLGVLLDDAFTFYYQENFDALRNKGAELIFINSLSDKRLPGIDGLYIGGGFPECFLDQLSQMKHCEDKSKEQIENNLPVYAECGGLIYLCKNIEWNGVKKEMVGAIPADVEMNKKPVGYGYVELSSRDQATWFHVEKKIKAHEFHYSKLVNIDPKLNYLYDVIRGKGLDGEYDGVIYKNVIASYTHLHSTSVPEWAEQFVTACKEGPTKV